MQLTVRPSPIHGLGVFATADGSDVWIPLLDARDGPLLVAGVDKRTPWGKYINHADVPNARWVLQNGTWYAHAPYLRAGQEVTLSYMQGPWFVDKTGSFMSNHFGIHANPFQPKAYGGYGFPPIVIPIIGAVAAGLTATGAGLGLAASNKNSKSAAMQQAAATNPCVARLNQQIDGVRDGVGLFRWASASQQAAHTQKLQLEAQRDAYLANPASCPEYLLNQQATQATIDQGNNLPMYAIGGIALAIAGAIALAIVVKKV